MANNIFLLDDARGLLEMREQPYDSESLLQRLLEEYPALLAGDPLAGGGERRLVLVRREAAVPAEQDGAGRWSLDHLFVDQDGIPTLVEVKRSSDTRIRREVVGQMLDYAAHAVAHWTVDGLMRDFESTCEQAGRNAGDALAVLLGGDGDPDTFWMTVKTNLEAGRIRMVFVADAIPHAVRRVVEFLNDQMNPAEVLAIEVKQYLGSEPGVRTLVPRILGQTARAQARKTARDPSDSKREWDDEAILASLRASHEPANADVARRIFAWARTRPFQTGFIGGSKQGSKWFEMPSAPVAARILYIHGDGSGRAGLSFDRVKAGPFRSLEARRELADQFERIEGVKIPDEKLEGGPSIPLRRLQDEASLQRFFEALDWFVERVAPSNRGA